MTERAVGGPRVGVIGAGISGLAMTRALARRGVEPVTFEASERPGGMIRTTTVDGHVLEAGPQRLRLVGPIATLIAELGLSSELRAGNDDQPLYIFHDGDFRVAPLSIREAITTDLLSWRGKLRVLGEPLADGPRPGESVEAFLTRSFGPEAAQRLFAPLYTGLYGSPADEMRVEYSLGRALRRHGIEGSVLRAALEYVLQGRDPPPIVTFDSGLARLPAAMAERYADAIRLDTPVERIEPAGQGYALLTDEDRTHVDAVAVTPPAPVAADLLEPVDSDLAEGLSGLRYNPIVVAHLHSTASVTGHGCQILPSEGYRTLGMTWNASMLDRDGIYTAYLGGGRDAEILESSDEEIGAIAAAEFETLLGTPAEALGVHRWEPGMPAYDASYEALEELELPENLALVSNYIDRAGIIGRLSHAERAAEQLLEGQGSSGER